MSYAIKFLSRKIIRPSTVCADKDEDVKEVWEGGWLGDRPTYPGMCGPGRVQSSASTFLSGKKDSSLLGVSWIFCSNREVTSQNFRSQANCTRSGIPREQTFSPEVSISCHRGTIEIMKTLPSDSC